MIRLFYFIVLSFLSAVTTVVFGQTDDKISISGQVFNEKNEPIGDAIVTLFTAQDNKIIKTESSDTSGKFNFTNIAKDNYVIKISVNGKERYSGDQFSANESLFVGTMTLLPDTKIFIT